MDTNESFQEFIYQLLTRSKLKKQYMDHLTNEASMAIYKSVFTHISVDPDNNYEFYEILGDVTLNKCIVWYIKDRFPILQDAEGVKIIARLRINMVSKKNFSTISERLGFLPFIRAEDEYKTTAKLPSLMEDVLEAFFGATELILDRMMGVGAGYGICFRLLKSILDEELISLKYEDLYDPITRLKETFDYYRPNIPERFCPLLWGSMRIENSKNEDNQQVVRLYQVDSMRKKLLVTKVSPFLDEGRQAVCLEYLEYLEKNGYKRPIPEYYASIQSKK